MSDYREVHARDMAAAKERMFTVEAEHLELFTAASGLRRAVIDLHGPKLMGPYIVCDECEGYDGGYLEFPCRTYELARDWEEHDAPPAD